ncbi:DUF2851 family protein [Thermogemmatispora carboxidivorans]|uniref:DUF2851 family protein n=1 Tax=Thermogemmatispora carboxidivorans TaxID=1382306 RepID=UPI000699F30A|nr:DUF2851 family protein [Thermogemmatispora carboxidivorans]
MERDTCSSSAVTEGLAPEAGSGLGEDEVARRWWALQPGALLPLSQGGSLLLLFPGRPGGRCGPDVRDAVLYDGRRELVGDVELHVRASDWLAHGHHQDARYNDVILHVVLICDHSTAPRRQDGSLVPLCSLYDAVITPADLPLLPLAADGSPARWPCQRLWPQMTASERAHLLTVAGTLRFEEKAASFVAALHQAEAHPPFSAYDVCLITALAEGLGYGRNRRFFRACGERLLGFTTALPEPEGRASKPPPLDAARLRALGLLLARWSTRGAWATLQPALHIERPQRAIAELRASLAPLSRARSDILICNAVLPFAYAVALIEGNEVLAHQARQLYDTYPALPSNQVTRAMTRQLLLPSEPRRACEQQGLHHIYQETCRAKRCGICMAGKQSL